MTAERFHKFTARGQTLGALAERLGLEAGDVFEPERVVLGFAALGEAEAGDLTFADESAEVGALARCRGAACLVVKGGRADGALNAQVSRINSGDPRLEFIRLGLALHEPATRQGQGISPLAFVSPSARVAESAVLEAFVFVGEEAVVGGGTRIASGAHIGAGVRVGDNCGIGANVVLEYCEVGNHCVIHAGTVVGGRGFGYATPTPLPENGAVPVPHLGCVRIHDHVEIGANCTIARATLGETVLERGVKLDAQVLIAHNVRIGAHSGIFGSVSVAGSVVVGEGVQIMSCAEIADHITIGDRAVVGPKSGVTQNVEPGETVLGYPAMPIHDAKRLQVILRTLARKGSLPR